MKKTVRIEGLDCANCAAKLERAIRKAAGVQDATINFMTAKLNLEAEPEQMAQVLATVEAIIKKTDPDLVMKKA